MLRDRNQIAEDYFKGTFLHSPSIESHISEDRFNLVQEQFNLKFDDFYHGYFRKNGSVVDANKALIRVAFTLFKETYRHLPLAYKNCAISSGTWAHLDAAIRNHHTTDRLSRVVGADWHGRTVKDNSQRSLERIERIKDLFIEVFFIAPTMFEGSTRVFSKGFGRQLTSLPFQAEEYMAFWNMVIDSCESFVLDDVRLDAPTIEQVEMEIDLAKSYSSQSRGRPLLQTSDWANSRNSVYEMARGNYIRFGVHPLRPDAKMDMRIYDQETHRLYPARLIDTLKPILQNILRWGPQGIAIDSACITVARLFDLHRMRIDTVYNGFQRAPLELEKLSPLVASPARQEIKEFEVLMNAFEPLLFNYFPHLYKADGLPIDYAMAQQKHSLKPSDIGEKSVRWQRENVPKNVVLDLWPLTLPKLYNPNKACKVKPISHGLYVPQRRQHDFENQPFISQEGEVWPDTPFEKLDPMFQQLAKAHIGVLEIVAQNSDVPEYKGIFCDLKRGEPALSSAGQMGLADLSLLAGALGKNFSAQVHQKNLEYAIDCLEKQRSMISGKGHKSSPAFGTPIIAELNSTINHERQFFNGPGPNSTPSDYRLALMMEMLRRNLTVIKLSKNWETSEDESRLMMLATKMEFGKVQRPAGNDLEIKIWDETDKIIPFSERIRRLYTYLSVLKQDEKIKRCLVQRDANSIEGYGIRYISLTLARMLEIYDCLRDQEYNAGRFEIRKVNNLMEFSTKLDDITDIRKVAISEIESEWCWLWQDEDFIGLRQEYRDKWMDTHGRQAQSAGLEPHHATGLRHSFGPR